MLMGWSQVAEMLLTARWVEVPGCVHAGTVQHDASISTDRHSPPQAWRDSTLILSSSFGETDPPLLHRVGESVHRWLKKGISVSRAESGTGPL